MEAARYTGMFSGFDGERWWKAGVDQIVFEASKGRPFDAQAVHEGLLRLSQAPVERERDGGVVVTVDADYVPSGLASVDEVVQLELRRLAAVRPAALGVDRGR